MIKTPEHDEPDDIPLLSHHVTEGNTGTRLDKCMADAFPAFSRTRLKNLIEDGVVSINDLVVTDASLKVQSGQIITFTEPEALDADPEPENIPLDIVYEDADLLVINKDADMVVHPAAGHHTGTLVNALLYHCGDSLSGIGGVKRPGIVHRLDRGTSGLMMVAKNDRTHVALQSQLSDRTLGRIYDAITFHIPMPPTGTIDKSIGRHPTHRLKMTTGGKEARDAITHYRVMDRFETSAAQVECRLATGRTHQIRVHMASIGCPLLGDALYGAQHTAIRAALKRDDYDSDIIDQILAFPRQALHAREIHFIHPGTGKNCSFTAPAPDDMQHLISLLNT